jgi:hypothetical protein
LHYEIEITVAIVIASGRTGAHLQVLDSRFRDFGECAIAVVWESTLEGNPVMNKSGWPSLS